MAVIIPVEEYEELLEDIHDLAIIAEQCVSQGKTDKKP
jgi:PHD/YefM family antitoxin component YafN of YafNO toxin-antitoxin module